MNFSEFSIKIWGQTAQYVRISEHEILGHAKSYMVEQSLNPKYLPSFEKGIYWLCIDSTSLWEKSAWTLSPSHDTQAGIFFLAEETETADFAWPNPLHDRYGGSSNFHNRWPYHNQAAIFLLGFVYLFMIRRAVLWKVYTMPLKFTHRSTSSYYAINFLCHHSIRKQHINNNNVSWSH